MESEQEMEEGLDKKDEDKKEPQKKGRGRPRKSK
jgi:hypothetical protein